MYYYYFSMEERKVKGEKYYLEEDKAAKLKELFEKYINLQKSPHLQHCLSKHSLFAQLQLLPS